MTQGGAALPVIASTDPPAAGPALRIAVVSDGRAVQAGPAQRVVVVSDGRPSQGNPPIPVVVATGAQAGRVLAGPPIAVVVVSGTLGGAPVNVTPPVISGVASAGETLTASDGTWDGAPTSYAYQWYRNGTAMSGATASTYTLRAADELSSITVTVTATNAAGSTSATSAALLIPVGFVFFRRSEPQRTLAGVGVRGLDYFRCSEPLGGMR